MAIAACAPPNGAQDAPTLTMGRGSTRVGVLEHLDDCLNTLEPSQAQAAVADCVAPVLGLEVGVWRPPADAQRCGDWLGLLVTRGLLTRAVELSGHRVQELLGPGDILRPWDDNGLTASVPSASSWRVIEPATVALLDGRFAARAALWPQVGVCLLRAAVRRSHAKTDVLAFTRVRHADARLMLLFWHLADRWGRVGTGGIHIPLRLTHALLAELVCLRRPTVSTALSQLRARRALARCADGTWRLAIESR